MDENTRTILQAPFRKDQIKQRPGSFGSTLSYIEGSAVVERINLAFNHEWSFEILRIDIQSDVGEVLAHVRISAGEMVKEGFGSSQITRQRDNGEIVDLGSNVKAACTDGLKKAATLLGVGLSLYQSDAPDETLPLHQEHPTEPPPAHQAQTHRQQHPPATASGSRLTAKQKSLILNLAGEAGLSHSLITQHCQQAYGCTVDFLSKGDASKLIEALFAGQVKAA